MISATPVCLCFGSQSWMLPFTGWLEEGRDRDTGTTREGGRDRDCRLRLWVTDLSTLVATHWITAESEIKRENQPSRVYKMCNFSLYKTPRADSISTTWSRKSTSLLFSKRQLLRNLPTFFFLKYANFPYFQKGLQALPICSARNLQDHSDTCLLQRENCLSLTKRRCYQLEALCLLVPSLTGRFSSEGLTSSDINFING